MVAVDRSVLPEWCEQNGRKAGSIRMVAVERSVLPRWWVQNGRTDGSTRMITVEQSVPKQSARGTEWWRQNCRSHDSTQANSAEDNPGSVCRKPTAYGTIGSRENIGDATAAVAEELMGKSIALVESFAVDEYLLHTTCRENNCSSISYAHKRIHYKSY